MRSCTVHVVAGGALTPALMHRHPPSTCQVIALCIDLVYRSEREGSRKGRKGGGAADELHINYLIISGLTTLPSTSRRFPPLSQHQVSRFVAVAA